MTHLLNYLFSLVKKKMNREDRNNEERYSHFLFLHVKPASMLIGAYFFAISVLKLFKLSSGYNIRPEDELRRFMAVNRPSTTLLFIINLVVAIFSAIFIYGVTKSKASYLMPFFVIQLYHFIVSLQSSLSQLNVSTNSYGNHYGTNNVPSPSDVRSVLRTEDNTNNVTISVLETFIEFICDIYFICVIWKCYRYLKQNEIATTLTSCRLFSKIIQHQTIKYDTVPLSPLSKHRLSLVKRKILVLDLDETLIHSTHDGVIRQMVTPGTPADFVLKVTIDRHPVRFFVHKRPHVDYFLKVVSDWYELVVFTASMEIYGAAVADKLDNNRNILKRRYFRQHCTLECGSYTKDLSAISPDLSSIFILDNSPGAYKAFPNNAIPISSWFSDPRDTALLNLLPVLDALRFTSDVRSVLSRNLHLHNMW